MSNLTLTVPKDGVSFEGDFAVVDMGMEQEAFVMAMLQYVGSGKDIVAVMKKED